MKNTSFLLLAAMLLAPACDKFHDNIQPADDLPIGSVYKTAADLESALNGVYNSLQSGSLAGANFYLVPEIMGGNGHSLITAGNPDFSDLAVRQLRSSNYFTEEIWTEAYKAINLANAVLAALETVQDAALTPEVRSRMEGEALFIRGYLFFELVRYFGQPYGNSDIENGVPLVTEAVFQKGDLTFPARSTVQQVYDQATADLTRARGLLPTSQPADRANPNAAIAMLAKIAFQKGDYPQAADLAKILVENPGLSLTARPADFFHDDGLSAAEMIWTVAFTAADGSQLAFWYNENLAAIGISDELKAAMESIATPAQQAAAQSEGLFIHDLRATPPLISADTVYTNKFEDISGKADDAPMARLSEFILMRAECLARSGDLPGAVDLLNKIRARSLRVRDVNGDEPADKQNLALFAPADFADADALIEAIILERRVELCFEGNFFQDMIRLHRDIGGLHYDECRLRWPIPQREMDANKNLKQNGTCY